MFNRATIFLFDNSHALRSVAHKYMFRSIQERNYKTRHSAKKILGFTLLELLVVMVIIGLLAGYVAPNYFGVVGKSEVKAAKVQADALQKALIAYRLDVGHFPSNELGLGSLYTKPVGVAKWRGPYLAKSVPLDPWGHAYIYRQPGQHGEFDIISYGRDGRPGGEDEDADISNW